MSGNILLGKIVYLIILLNVPTNHLKLSNERQNGPVWVIDSSLVSFPLLKRRVRRPNKKNPWIATARAARAIVSLELKLQ